MEVKPIISVAMLVYNHGKYLDHALRSIFEQKIDVPFEVVIGEDCSQDQSRDIIDQWRNKYPDIIKPIYRNKNVGMEKNTNEVIFMCQGEYVAWLEGDDFWTDKDKLQKQLDFLQTDRAYIGAVHNTQVVGADEKPLLQHQEHYPICKEQDFTWNDFQRGHMPGQTATFFYRNIFAEMNAQERDLFCDCHANSDIRIIGILLLHGKIKVMEDVMAAYRFVVSGGSNWNSMTYGKNYALIYYEKILNLEKCLSSFEKKEMRLDGWRYHSFASAILWAQRNHTEEDKKILKTIWKMEKHKAGACIHCFKLALKHFSKK